MSAPDSSSSAAATSGSMPQAPVEQTSESDVLDTPAAGGLILRGGTLRFGSYVAMVGLSVLSTALLTRHLGLVAFSQYTTVMSLVSVVSVVTDSGMSSLGTREYAVRVGADRDALLRDLLGLRVTLTMVGVLLATVFAISAGYDSALLIGTVLASLATVALVAQHTLSIPLSALLRLGAVSLLELIRQTLTVALIVILIVLGAGVLPLLAVTLVVNFVLIPVTRLFVENQVSLRMSFRPRAWMSLLRLTVYFTLATAVGTIYVYTAQILTSLVASPHQSGLFAVSFRIFVVAAGVPGLLVGGALPMLARAARDDHERLAYAVRRIIELSLIAGVVASLAMLGGAQFVISVVGGPKWAAAAGVLQIQGLAMIASFLAAGWGFALISTRRYRSLLVANGAALATSCTLTLLLASSDGAHGAALATLCGESVLSLCSCIALARGHRQFRPPLAIVAKVALAAAPATALALYTGVPSILRALLAIAAYGVVIAATRALPREVLDLIPRRRRLAP